MALRAVYNDGNKQSVGSVRGMWSSGLVVETDVRTGIGSPFAIVILSGGFDGTRLAAEVAGVDKGALMLHLPGLDAARWARLAALVEGKPLTMPLPTTPPARQPPPNVPSFIISGGDGDDELSDPTGVVLLGADQVKPVPLTTKKSVPAPSPFDVPVVTDPFARAKVTTTERELETQVLELGRANAALVAENAKLKADIERVSGLKAAVEEELTEAMGKLDDIEKTLKR